MKKLLLVILVLLFLFSGCTASVPAVDPAASLSPALTDDGVSPSPEPTQASVPDPSPTPEPVVKTDDFRFTDYDGVLEALDEISTARSAEQSGYYGGTRFVTYGLAADGAADLAVPTAEAASEPTAAEAPESSKDWLGTNVQVADVDEGDIVKTDGEYIYVMRDSAYLEIYRASGADTLRVSRTGLNTRESIYDKTDTEDGWVSSGSELYIRDMYISADRLIFVGVESTYEERYSNEHGYVYDNECRTCTYIYDVSAPEAPVQISDIAQDGSYCSGRLYNGVLYLASCYDINSWVFDQPDTYIPRVYEYNAPQMLPADSIVRMPDSRDESYLVITATDASTGEQLSSQAILGAGYATMYMNSDCICLASSRWHDGIVSTYTESVYSVNEYVSGYKTHLVLLELLDDGTVSAASCGEVNGSIIGQFAIDEYNGNLRIVTTNNTSSYKVYTDDEYGFTNYVYPDNGGYSQSSGLYILDHDMNMVGSVTGLGENERVYSVRFDGDVAYFVTYRETDPLFAVDLSTPEAPAVMSALKIPGFSQYLHVYGDGLLFGLGMGEREDSEFDWERFLKLSMFDVSDPYDVTEQTTLLLDGSYSEALYDHHAVLVSPEKNIIGFPTDMAYEVYSYEDGNFVRLARISLDNDWNVRALYIGDWLYIVSPQTITVVSLSSWQTAAHIALG